VEGAGERRGVGGWSDASVDFESGIILYTNIKYFLQESGARTDNHMILCRVLF